MNRCCDLNAGAWNKHQATRPVGLSLLLQGPCWSCSRRWSGTVSLLSSVPPRPGVSTPKVEADVLMQSSCHHPAHHCDYCPPAVGPAAASQGKGCRGFFLGGKRCDSVGISRPPQETSAGLSGLTQLGIEHLVEPSAGRRG